MFFLNNTHAAVVLQRLLFREMPGFGLDLGDGSRGSQLWLVGTWIFINVDTIYQ